MNAMRTLLSSLTNEHISQAFEKAKTEVELSAGKLVLITEDMHHDVIEFAVQHFAAADPLSIGFGSHKQESMTDWSNGWRDTLQHNMSLAVIDKTNGEIIGIRLIRICKAKQTAEQEDYKDASYRAYCEFSMHCANVAKYFEHYDIDECFHFYCLAVHSEYRRRGFASALMDAAIRFCGHLGVEPVYIKGECSSKYSQRLFEKYGFKPLCEIVYADYVVDGRKMISCEIMEGHKSQKMYGKQISATK